MRFKVACGALTAALLSTSALATPAFVNYQVVPATTQDLSGDPGLNSRLGFFSDIYYDPNRNEWWALGDRGPGGGSLPYDTRVQRFTLDVNTTTGAISNFNVVQTIKFTDPNNVLGAGPGTLNGLAPSPTSILGRSFDPEGFVVNPVTGKFLVSDEYGPSVYEFNRDGTLSRKFNTPAGLIPRNTGTNTPNFAADPVGADAAGKRTNRGFEGLAISPDGKYAYAMLQSAMLDEGAGSGVFNRIVVFDTETGNAVKQFAYKMEGSSQGRGISAIIALNDHEFLVLERNNRGMGVDSELTPGNKKIFKIDINGATDVTGMDLTNNGTTLLDPSIVLVSKTLFDDVASDITIAELGNLPPEKLEGLAIGPKLVNGQYVIVLGTDSDFSITQDPATSIQFDEYFNPTNQDRIRCTIGTFDNCFVVNDDGSLGGAFAGATTGFQLLPGLLFSFVSTGDDLAGYVGPVPAPGAVALFGLGGLAAFGLRRRRKG